MIVKQLSASAHVYEGLKLFRDTIMAHIRQRMIELYGAQAIKDRIKTLFKGETWDKNVENARLVRTAGLVSSPLIDELDAQDARSFPKIFDRFDEKLTPDYTPKTQLLPLLREIEQLRNPIGHPGEHDISKSDAYRALDVMGRAASQIFSSDHKLVGYLLELRNTTLGLSDSSLTEPVVKSLPPRQEVVADFVGRYREMHVLSLWLASDVDIWVLEGDGGKGKTALAYHFVEQIRSFENGKIQRVIWLSAKRRRFTGKTESVTADFDDLTSSVDRILECYGCPDDTLTLDDKCSFALELFRESPPLIVLDDIDSIEAENERVIFWFTSIAITKTPARLLLTSRRQLFSLGGYTTKVAGFTYDETVEYLRIIGRRIWNDAYKLSNPNIAKLIHETCEGSPLYIEDLLRLILVIGKPADEAVAIWREHTGQLAREYALRREFDMLSAPSKRILLACAIENEHISAAELKAVIGLSQDDLFVAVSELQRLYLISYPDVASLSPQYEINDNLRRLIRQVMCDDAEYQKIATVLSQLRSNTRKPRRCPPEAQRAIREAVAVAGQGRFEEAISILKTTLVTYPMEGAVLSSIGWIFSRAGAKHQTDALDYLEQAVRLKHRDRQPYLTCGRLYEKLCEPEKGLRVVECGLSLFPEDVDLIYIRTTCAIDSAFAMVRSQSLAAGEERVKRAVEAFKVTSKLTDPRGPLAGRRAELAKRFNALTELIQTSERSVVHI